MSVIFSTHTHAHTPPFLSFKLFLSGFRQFAENAHFINGAQLYTFSYSIAEPETRVCHTRLSLSSILYPVFLFSKTTATTHLHPVRPSTSVQRRGAQFQSGCELCVVWVSRLFSAGPVICSKSSILIPWALSSNAFTNIPSKRGDQQTPRYDGTLRNVLHFTD